MTSFLPTKEYGGSFGTTLAQATKISVSAWPIIFAAIAAQSLRTIAAYKVERGVRLMASSYHTLTSEEGTDSRTRLSNN
jgi:hypothetical protein